MGTKLICVGKSPKVKHIHTHLDWCSSYIETPGIDPVSMQRRRSWCCCCRYGFTPTLFGHGGRTVVPGQPTNHLQRAEELHYSQDSHATVTEVCLLWQTSAFFRSKMLFFETEMIYLEVVVNIELCYFHNDLRWIRCRNFENCNESLFRKRHGSLNQWHQNTPLRCQQFSDILHETYLKLLGANTLGINLYNTPRGTTGISPHIHFGSHPIEAHTCRSKGLPHCINW